MFKIDFHSLPVLEGSNPTLAVTILCAYRYVSEVKCKTVSFQRNADEKIEEAIARGEFDNLPGNRTMIDAANSEKVCEQAGPVSKQVQHACHDPMRWLISLSLLGRKRREK